MVITREAKKSFEQWYINNFKSIFKDVFNNDDVDLNTDDYTLDEISILLIEAFYKLPLIMQFSVYIDWGESVGILCDFTHYEGVGNEDYRRGVDVVFKDKESLEWLEEAESDTLTELRPKVIEKLCYIYSDNLLYLVPNI